MTDQRGQISDWLDKGRTLSDGTRMTNERLHEVFDMVKDTEHWKNPIVATVPVTDATADEIQTAVAWFCGGFPEVWQEGNEWRVEGAGYWGWGMDGV